ncbi:hypothetical protein [Phormidesmis sp. 146-33]
MLRFIFTSGLFLLTIMLTIAEVKAQSIAPKPMVGDRSTTLSMNAFELASMAYRGAFRNQGIPGYGFLIAAHSQGQLSARDIVQAAINTNRLPAEMLNDQGFLSAVEANLRAFKSSSFSP